MRDLSQPTLENLSYVLRHKEMWPEGFEWDYKRADSCAAGLAVKKWSVSYWFMPLRVLFMVGRRADEITPEHVADALDCYIRKHRR